MFSYLHVFLSSSYVSNYAHRFANRKFRFSHVSNYEVLTSIYFVSHCTCEYITNKFLRCENFCLREFRITKYCRRLISFRITHANTLRIKFYELRTFVYQNFELRSIDADLFHFALYTQTHHERSYFTITKYKYEKKRLSLNLFFIVVRLANHISVFISSIHLRKHRFFQSFFQISYSSSSFSLFFHVTSFDFVTVIEFRH